jgi:hypothetical protein
MSAGPLAGQNSASTAATMADMWPTCAPRAGRRCSRLSEGGKFAGVPRITNPFGAARAPSWPTYLHSPPRFITGAQFTQRCTKLIAWRVAIFYWLHTRCRSQTCQGVGVDIFPNVQDANKSRLTSMEFNARTYLARNLVALISLASLLMPLIFKWDSYMLTFLLICQF